MGGKETWRQLLSKRSQSSGGALKLKRSQKKRRVQPRAASSLMLHLQSRVEMIRQRQNCGGEKTVAEDEEEKGENEDKEQVEAEEKSEVEEKSEDEEKGEKEQLDDIKKSLEKVDKKLFLIGSLLDKKFKEVLAQLQNDTGSRGEESTTTKVTARKIDPTRVELAKSAKNDSSTEEPTLVEVKKLAKLAKNDSSTEEPNIKLNPKLGPKRVEVGKSAEN